MAALREQLRVFTGGLGPLASKAIAAAAHDLENQIVAQQKARRGVTPGVETAVDGNRSAPFESVRPDGKIFMQFDYRAEIIAALFAELKARSPVVSGAYARNHFVQLDGRGIAPLTVPSAQELLGVSTVTLTNPLPYSRKLEVGVTKSGRPFVKQVDPHIFEGAMEAVRRDYRGVAHLEFAFIDLENAYVLKTNADARRVTERKSRGAGNRLRYPAIVITRGTN